MRTERLICVILIVVLAAVIVALTLALCSEHRGRLIAERECAATQQQVRDYVERFPGRLLHEDK